MKRVMNYIKNTSIGIQLMLVFLAIGIVISGVAMGALRLNYRTTEKHSQYLEYIAMLGELSELAEVSKSAMTQIGTVSKEEQQLQVIRSVDEANRLINLIRLEPTSVDISLRLRVVEYLFKQYENKMTHFITIRSQVGRQAQYDSYVEVVETLNRIDPYIQEMISFSVKENKAFLETALQNGRNLQYMLIIMVAAVLCMAMYICMRYSQYMQRLISNVVALTRRISAGNQVEGLQEESGPEEVREIIISFNELIKAMKTLHQEADEKVRLELELAAEALEKSRIEERLKEAQLQGLQLQIRPHFLFNTLNAISMMAIIDNNRKVYDVIMALSKFMRYSLKQTLALVPLQEEVDMVRQYLYILKVRMGDKLAYQVHNSVSRAVEIPPFTLQPIVENAFSHGLENKIAEGKIIVRIKQQSNCVILQVFNNGIPIEPEILSGLRKRCQGSPVRLNQEQHIGIENVVHRLCLSFGERVSLKIYSSRQRGTLFTIKIALEEVMEELDV